MQDHPTSEQKHQAFNDTVKFGLENFMTRKSIRVCNQASLDDNTSEEVNH